jgi:hypothetical protein
MLDTLRHNASLQLGHHSFDLARGSRLPIELLWDACRSWSYFIGQPHVNSDAQHLTISSACAHP